MFHNDRHYDGCSSGPVLSDLRCLPWCSGYAQSTLLLQTVAWLCRHSHDLAHHSVSVVCRCSIGCLLGSVSSSVLSTSLGHITSVLFYSTVIYVFYSNFCIQLRFVAVFNASKAIFSI